MFFREAIQLTLLFMAPLALCVLGLGAGGTRPGFGFALEATQGFLLGLMLLSGRPLLRALGRSPWRYLLPCLVLYLLLSHQLSPAPGLMMSSNRVKRSTVLPTRTPMLVSSGLSRVEVPSISAPLAPETIAYVARCPDRPAGQR